MVRRSAVRHASRALPATGAAPLVLLVYLLIPGLLVFQAQLDVLNAILTLVAL